MRIRPPLLLLLTATIAILYVVQSSNRSPSVVSALQSSPLTVTVTLTATSTPTPPDNYLPAILKQPTYTPTPTPTFTPTNTPTPTRTPTPTPFVIDLFCNLPIVDIPDNDPVGITDTLTIDEVDTIADLDVYLNIEHSWVGDLIVSLTHEDTGTDVTLIDRPGVPASTLGCPGDNVDVLLDEAALNSVETACNGVPPAISGRLRPNQSLDDFIGEDLDGDWILQVSDNTGGDTGVFNGWCMLVLK